MAFTFQINNDKFRHDERLLAKAEACRPAFHSQTRKPTGLVQLKQDDSFLEGWTTEPVGMTLEDLQLGRGDSLILDFGTHEVGYFSIDIDSVGSPMDAPLHLEIRFAEVPAELAHTSDEYDGWLSSSWIQEERIHLDELPCHLDLPRRYAFRYVQIRVLDTSPKWKAVFSDPEVRTETSADWSRLPERSFQDPELQEIYEVGLKTLADCMTDVFEDGPKRDRRLWLGDLRLQALASYASFDNADLVRRCLYLFAAMNTEEGKIAANVFVKPRNVPDDTFLFDYSLFFISALHDYLAHHPDPEVLEDLWPAAREQMALSLESVDENGLYQMDESWPVFADWSNDFDKQTTGQAILIYVLRQFIELGERKGEDMQESRTRLQQLEQAAREHLYDPQRGLFVSRGDYNLSSQVWMVLSGMLDAQEKRQVMESAVAQLFPVTGIATPYMYHHITHALFEAGLDREAQALMKSYWGAMIRLGADTYWEAFDPADPSASPYGSPIVSSYCHAWSCTPVWLLETYRDRL